MSNLYFNNVRTMVGGSRARGETVEDDFDSVSVAFDMLPTPEAVAGEGWTSPIKIGAAVLGGQAIQRDQLASWPVAVNANDFALTGLKTATGSDPSEVANVSYVNTMLTLGGTPGNVAITGLALGTATAGQVLRANDAGAAVIGSNTLDAMTLTDPTIKGDNVTLSNTAGNITYNIDAVANTISGLALTIGGLRRWSLLKNNDPESGANSGSTLHLACYDDTGAFQNEAFSIQRSSGSMTFGGAPGGYMSLGAGHLNTRGLYVSGIGWFTGSGTPEGVQTAPIGAFYSRTDGGAGTTLYVKETGAGNTGWVGK